MPKSGCMNAILSFALVSDINNFSPFNRKRVTYKPVQQFAFEIQYNKIFTANQELFRASKFLASQLRIF